MAKVKVKTRTKTAKKKFPVRYESPEFLGSVNLGEYNVTSLEKLKGKKLMLNLMFLTKNVRHQNVRLYFRVTDVHTGVAKTEVCNYEVISYYLSKMLRKGTTLIEDNFVAENKEERKLKISPFIVTKNQVSGTVKTEIRKKVRELLSDYMKKSTAEEVYNGVITGNLQSYLRNEIKNIVPVKALDFKKIQLTK